MRVQRVCDLRMQRALAAWIVQALLLLPVYAADEPSTPAAKPPARPADAVSPPSAAGPLRFRRVYAPADRVKDWPRDAVRYVPISPAEFERLVELAGAEGGVKTSNAEQITSARYTARLAGDVLADGEAVLQIAHADRGPAMLPLDPFGLAMGQAAWSGPQGPAARLGIDPDGILAVQVEHSGPLWLTWSLGGHRDATGSIDFAFELPACPASTLVIDVPNTLTPLADCGVVVKEGEAGKDAQKWRIELGGRPRLKLRLVPAADLDPAGKSNIVRQAMLYDFTPRGLDLSAQLTIDVPDAPLRQLALELDPGLQLVDARCGDLALRWSTVTAAGDGRATVVVELPGIFGTGRIRLSAIAPLELDRAWRLPGIRPQGVFWQEGTATLIVPAPMVVEQLTPIHARQTETGPLAAPRSGETIELQYFAADATAELWLGRREAPLEVDCGTAMELGRTETTARIVARCRLAEGQQFEIHADLGRQWTIDSLETVPAGALGEWFVEEAKAADGTPGVIGKARGVPLLGTSSVAARPGSPTSAGAKRSLSQAAANGPTRNSTHGVLTVRLAKALSSSRPVGLVIAAHQKRSPPGATLSSEDLAPLRFRGVRGGRRLMNLRAAEACDLKLGGDVRLAPIEPRRLTPADRELFAPAPRGPIYEAEAGAGLRVTVEPRNPKRGPARGPEASVSTVSAAAPPAASAWVWRARIESRFEPDGTGSHAAVYQLENAGRQRFLLSLPPGVACEEVRSVSVDADPLEFRSLAADNDNCLSIPLPSESRFPTVSVHFTTAAGRLGIAASLACPMPQADLPVLSRSWMVWLPPGYELCDSSVAELGWTGTPLSVGQRLLGPLARSPGRAPFNPLAAKDWQEVFGQSGQSGRPAADAKAEPSVRHLEDAEQALADPQVPSLASDRSEAGASDAPGWTAYRFELADDPPPVLAVVHRDTLRGFRWISLLGVFALVWWRGGRRWTLLIASAGVLGTMALLLPEVAASLCSGAMLGILAALLGRLVGPGRRQPAAAEENHTTQPSSTARLVTRAAPLVLFALAAVLAQTARGQTPGPSAPVAARPGVASVFIPIDDKEKPTGAKYYVPEDLYRELQRYAGAATGGPQEWILSAASYRGTLARQSAPDQLAFTELKATFQLEVFGRGVRVRLPLGHEGLRLAAGGASLEGRAIQPEWDENGNHLVFEVADAGHYRLELSLRPTVETRGGVSQLDARIPRLASSRLELDIPGDALRIEVPSALGGVVRQSDPPRLVAQLGPGDRLRVRWPETGPRGGAGPAADVEQLLWLKIQPGAVVLDTVMKVKGIEGRLRRLELAADPRLRLLPLPGERGSVSRVQSVPGRPQTIRFQLSPPAADQVAVSASFLLADSSGIGNLRLPWVEVMDARVTRRWMAVSVDPTLEYREHVGRGLPPVALPDFLQAWGTAKTAPLLAYRLAAGRPDWAISTTPVAPRISADQTLSWSFDRSEAQVLLEAHLASIPQPPPGDIRGERTTGKTPGKPSATRPQPNPLPKGEGSELLAFQYRIAAPPALEVQRVSVREDGVQRVVRWSRAADGAITVFLNGPALGKQDLTLGGRWPLEASGAVTLPRIEVMADQVDRETIQLFREPAVRVRVTGSPGWNDVEQPAVEESKASLGRLVKALSRPGNQPADGHIAGPRTPTNITVLLSPNRPKVRAEQTTVLSLAGATWEAEIEFRVAAPGGLIDELRVEMPLLCPGPYKVNPPAALKTVDLPDSGRHQLVIRPPAAIEGEYRFRLSSPLVLAAGQQPRVPEVVLAGADLVKHLVLLPSTSPAGPIGWETSGLEKIDVLPGAPAARDGMVAYKVRSRPFSAVLRAAGSAGTSPHVVLADYHVGWQPDGSCYGQAALDLEPAGLTECPLVMPPGYALLHATVAGKTVTPLPAAGPDDRATIENQWRLPLGPSNLPQRIEILFAGRLSNLSAAATRQFDAPTLADLPVGKTLWRVSSPPFWHISQESSDCLNLEYASPGGHPWAKRLLAALGLAVLTGTVIVGVRSGAAAAVWSRWPHAVLIAAGLAWWLAMEPSLLGWALVLAGLIASFRRGKRQPHTHPAR